MINNNRDDGRNDECQPVRAGSWKIIVIKFKEKFRY